MLRDVANGWLVFDDGGPCVPVPDGVGVRETGFGGPGPARWVLTGAWRAVLLDAGDTRGTVMHLLGLTAAARATAG